MSVFVVTGTDTDIGKTVFAAALAGALDGCYWKPVQSGLASSTDSERVRALSGLPADRILNEAYRLSEPLSPHRSAELDGVALDPASLDVPSCDRVLVIEGAGGALVPLDRQTLTADLFARWGQPVIVCARTGLGTINHTLMTLEVLAVRNVPVFGIAFIGDANPDNIRTISEFSGVRVLGRLPHIENLHARTLAEAFAEGFDKEVFSL